MKIENRQIIPEKTTVIKEEELLLNGNSLEVVSQSAALVQQSTMATEREEQRLALRAMAKYEHFGIYFLIHKGDIEHFSAA